MPLPRRLNTSRLASCTRWRSQLRSVVKLCQTDRRSAILCRATRRAAYMVSVCPGGRPLGSSTNSTRGQGGFERSQNKGAAWHSGRTRAAGLIHGFCKSHRRGNREVGQGSKVLWCQAEITNEKLLTRCSINV